MKEREKERERERERKGPVTGYWSLDWTDLVCLWTGLFMQVRRVSRVLYLLHKLCCVYPLFQLLQAGRPVGFSWPSCRVLVLVRPRPSRVGFSWERERESKLLWGKKFSRQTDAATQGSSSSSSSVAAGSRDQGGRRGRRVSDKDYYYYYYYSFDSLMCVIRRVDRKKLAVQQSSLTAWSRVAWTLMDCIRWTFFVLFVLYSFLFREALALIMYCCNLALCRNLRVNYLFVSSFVVV
jgi:hypothetical protein